MGGANIGVGTRGGRRKIPGQSMSCTKDVCHNFFKQLEETKVQMAKFIHGAAVIKLPDAKSL